MDAQTLRDCADHIADSISKAIDSIGPIELGPDTQTAIILHALIARSSVASAPEELERLVVRASELQKEIRRQR